MKRYKQAELRRMVERGEAENITNAEYSDALRDLDKIGLSFGANGMNGGLLEDPKTGRKYAITARNTLLFQLF